MELEYEERIWSILRGGDGFIHHFDEISEFKLHLNDAGLEEQQLDYGCVLWRSGERRDDAAAALQHKIATLFRHIASTPCFCYHYLVQFWAVVESEGQRRLSTSDQPFSIGNLSKGLCWYRKLCMDHAYHVGQGAREEQLGGVGRAYRNKHPESTPDLRLYSVDEFPLHDHAARCGLKGYLTLPLFDAGECCGVLELISGTAIGAYQLSTLDAILQNAGLRSTHINFMPIGQSIIMPDKYREESGNEITEMLELAMKEVPRLQLAQVWVPCKQCANMRCLERTSFISAWRKRVNLCKNIDEDMFLYLQACEFHRLQVDLKYVHQSLCDLSISKNPLAHHAKKARLFHSFSVHLQSLNNGGDPCVVEFFLQPKGREDSRVGDSSLHSLLRITEMKLKTFTLASRELLPPELLIQPMQPNAVECESADMVSSSYMERFSEPDFIEFLEAADSCHLRPSSDDSDSEWPSSEDSDEGWRSFEGWVFCRTAGDELSEGDIDNSNSLHALVKEKIKHVLKKLANKLEMKYSMAQFWAAGLVEGRWYLQTWDQPYTVGCLALGLASFRKKCMRHRYFVDEEAEEDELGPPGRVFRNKHPEITPDLSLYSKKEFPVRNYAVDSGLRQYLALPVFDKRNHRCVGVLELVGFRHSTGMKRMIQIELEKTSLCSTHIGISPSFLENGKPRNITNCRKQALRELREAFLLITEIPQFHKAQVLVPHEECDGLNSNAKCMELALSMKDVFSLEEKPVSKPFWIYVQPGKGIIGMALESESKSCFCRNICEFSIVDQPLVHEEMRERACVCFVVCLQSSHTGDLLYVAEFFLNRSPHCLVSFLNFLLPIMTKQLKSFKYACGRQLGEELVVDVIDFSEATMDLVSELGQPDVFPIKYRSVRYGQMEHRHSDATQTEQSNITIASDFKKTKRQRRRTGFHLSFDVLKPHFGKKMQDAAEDLGVGRSTLKRACRDSGIHRWPCKEKQTRNPSLYEREEQVTCHSSNSKKHAAVEEGNEKVMVKVKYEEDTIKFEFCLSSGVSKLYEEVGAGLNLKMGSFKLKYLDEDDDEILLSRDADLQHCPKNPTIGQICIRLFVQSICKLA